MSVLHQLGNWHVNDLVLPDQRAQAVTEGRSIEKRHLIHA
jgi:hypothetical protein